MSKSSSIRALGLLSAFLLALTALTASTALAQEPAPAPVDPAPVAPAPADPAPAPDAPAAADPAPAAAPAVPAVAGPPQVRQSWQAFSSGPDGAKRVASLLAAVSKMKSLDKADPKSADFRRSWAYWANIHGYYGPVSRFGTVEQKLAKLIAQDMSQYTKYYTGIADQTPPDEIATAVWATCQHSTRTSQANFFGWHRMYLYYFEQVLRWAANDDSLRLPYWDYTSVEQLAIPAPYREVKTWFYDPRRDPGMNGGATIDPDLTDVDDQLGDADYKSYELSIEQGVHGNVHCTVGPTCPVAHMGDVPVAGNDPVFYSHHANIDRLWACWQQLYPTPAGEWQEQRFSFPDADGNLQTRPVSDFLDTAALGFVYDNVTDCKRPAAGPRVAAGPGGAAKEPAMLSRTQAIKVDKARISVGLGLSKAKLRTGMQALAPAEKVMLVLHDVKAESHPGVIFKVFLSKKGDAASRRAVGSINWFGAFHDHDGGHAATAAEARTFEFDVTQELAALGDAEPTVEIEATTGRVMADAAAAQAETEKAVKAFRAAAKVTIGAIELRTSGAEPQPGT